MAESTASRLDRSARESRQRPPHNQDADAAAAAAAAVDNTDEDNDNGGGGGVLEDDALDEANGGVVVGGLDDVEDEVEEDVDIGAMLDEAGAVGGVGVMVAEALTKVPSDSEEPSNFKVNQPDGAAANPHSWRHHQPQPQDDYWRDEFALAAAAAAADDDASQAQQQQQLDASAAVAAVVMGGNRSRIAPSVSTPPSNTNKRNRERALSPPPPQPLAVDDYQVGRPAAANNDAQQVHQNNVGLYNWQATKMTVKERLGFLFNSNILSDVTFVVGRGSQVQRIPAHKFVLSVGSAVFDAMFNSTLATQEEEIELPDVEAASFLALLRFLYSDEVQIGPDSVMTTLYTAKKYAVPALEKHCVDFLKRHLCADNAFMLLTQARLFDEPQLAALCLDTIDKATPEALGAEGFTEIDIDTLSAVLDRDSLRIKEAKLFTAVIRWSEAECLRQNLPVIAENKRSVLGRVLTQIRFPLMTVEEFAQGPAQSGILTDRECVSLFLHFTVNPKPPVGFLDVPRCSMTGKEQTVSRFQQIESRWGYSGTSDKIRFMVDRRIFVVGFGLYGSIHGPSEYQANIQISHTTSARVLGANSLTFSSDGTNATFRVMFKDPVEILPNTNYTASATLKGLDSHYGTKGLRKVGVECSTGGKVTFNFSYAAGNNNGTSIEDGQIPEIIFYT